MKIRGSVVSLSFIFSHPPEEVAVFFKRPPRNFFPFAAAVEFTLKTYIGLILHSKDRLYIRKNDRPVYHAACKYNYRP